MPLNHFKKKSWFVSANLIKYKNTFSISKKGAWNITSQFHGLSRHHVCVQKKVEGTAADQDEKTALLLVKKYWLFTVIWKSFGDRKNNCKLEMGHIFLTFSNDNF